MNEENTELLADMIELFGKMRLGRNQTHEQRITGIALISGGFNMLSHDAIDTDEDEENKLDFVWAVILALLHICEYEPDDELTKEVTDTMTEIAKKAGLQN